MTLPKCTHFQQVKVFTVQKFWKLTLKVLKIPSLRDSKKMENDCMVLRQNRHIFSCNNSMVMQGYKAAPISCKIHVELGMGFHLHDKVIKI